MIRECKNCIGKQAEPGKDECFHCRVSGVGFTFTGGGRYGRKAFNDRTIAERRAEVLGDRKLGVDVVPSSDFGW